MSTHPFDHIKMKTAPAYMQSEVQDYNLKRQGPGTRKGSVFFMLSRTQKSAGDLQGVGFLYVFTYKARSV